MPRTSNKPTGEVWRLLEEWSSAHPMRPNQSVMAELFGVSKTLISSWKHMEVRMQPAEQIKIQEVTQIPVEKLAAAIAIDEGNGMSENIAARRRKYAEQVDEAAVGDDEEPP